MSSNIKDSTAHRYPKKCEIQTQKHKRTYRLSLQTHRRKIHFQDQET